MFKRASLTMSLITAAVLVICLSVVTASPVGAIPPLPHGFYGNVTINEQPAPVGTTVEVRGEGVNVGVSGNPIMTSEVGKYGVEGVGTKLIAQGDIVDNPLLSFYINGEKADQTYTWQSGVQTRLDLTVTIEQQLPPLPQSSTFQGTLFGKAQSISISGAGEILEAVKVSATLPKGTVEVNIKSGTVALDKNGNPLASLTSKVDASPPAAPEGFSGILLPCDFGPEGATFSPPITLTFHYNSADIPENTSEEDLVLAFYDKTAGKWVTLSSEVDAANNTITVLVAHFTSFAILVPAPEVEEKPETTPPAPEPQTTSPEKPATSAPAPASSEEPPASTTGETPSAENAPSAAGEETGTNTNWLVIGIIAAVVLIIVFVVGRSIYIRNRY